MSVIFKVIFGTLTFFAGLVSLQYCSAQNKKNYINFQDSIYASYINKAPGGLAFEEITFKKDHTFTYRSGTDIEQVFSSGFWQKVKDTFVVNSFLKRNDLPISIQESTNVDSDTLVFDWVKDSNGNIVKGAAIYINGDTSKSYMPVWNECRFEKGKVEKIMLTFDNHSSTKWYFLKNKYDRKVSITLEVDTPLINYVFFLRMKFLAKQDRLYRLNGLKGMGNIEGNGEHINEHYFLSKKQGR